MSLTFVNIFVIFVIVAMTVQFHFRKEEKKQQRLAEIRGKALADLNSRTETIESNVRYILSELRKIETQLDSIELDLEIFLDK